MLEKDSGSESAQLPQRYEIHFDSMNHFAHTNAPLLMLMVESVAVIPWIKGRAKESELLEGRKVKGKRKEKEREKLWEKEKIILLKKMLRGLSKKQGIRLGLSKQKRLAVDEIVTDRMAMERRRLESNQEEVREGTNWTEGGSG